MQEIKKPTLEEAQAWGEKRKRDGETLTVLECPCCKTYLAIYTGAVEKVTFVPDTTPANPELPS